MKKLNLIFVAALAIGTMQACHNSTSGNSADTTATTDTGVAASDTSKMMAAPDSGDVKFATAAACGGMTEIALSKVALQKTNSSKIKDFANMMITDHTAAGNKLTAIAKEKNIPLPNNPDATQQKMIDSISKKSGGAFDKAYVNQMLTDHINAVAMFESAEKTVQDTTLKAFITNTLPVLHKHLNAIKAIKDRM